MKQSELPIEDMKKHQQKLKAISLKLEMERITVLCLQTRSSKWIRQEIREQAHGLMQCHLRSRAFDWTNKSLGTPYMYALQPSIVRFTKLLSMWWEYVFLSTISCKKGGFVAQRHDGIRDLLTSVISKVCKNVESEPHLQPFDNERLNLRTANTSPQARLDIKEGGFWSRGVTACFDVRVMHV